jgi:hypothetical protein
MGRTQNDDIRRMDADETSVELVTIRGLKLFRRLMQMRENRYPKQYIVVLDQEI